MTAPTHRTETPTNRNCPCPFCTRGVTGSVHGARAERAIEEDGDPDKGDPAVSFARLPLSFPLA
jgi:hypothetical protein